MFVFGPPAIAVGWGCGGGASSHAGDAGTDSSETSDSARGDGTLPEDAPGDAVPTDSTVATDAPDEGNDGGSDAGAVADADADTDTDAAPDALEGSCGEAGQPCTYAGTHALCNAALACAPCQDPLADAAGNDDPACASAYGGAQICVGGVCTPGECRNPVDCVVIAGLPYCGTSHFCGTCIHDIQCPGAAPFCDYRLPDGGIGGGRCVAGAGLTACGDAGDNAPCPSNPGDVCCGGACQSGVCCSAQAGAAFCQATQGPSLSCVSNICTTCPSPAGTDFYVDPIHGDDTLGTGSFAPGDGGGSTGCAFRTITRALTLIPAAAAPGTRIIVLGPSSVGAGETFPIPLRSNIVLTTQGGAVSLGVPSGALATTAVQLLGTGAGIQSGVGAPLTLSGNSFSYNAALPDDGVDVGAGTDATTFLENVTLQNFSSAGIGVGSGAVLTIRQGVVSTGAQQFGLVVEGRVAIDVAAGQVPTSFSANELDDYTTGAPRVSGDGIWVSARGSLDLHGAPGAASGTGTVLTSGNAESGVTFLRSGSTPPPPSVVDGLVSYGNGPSGSGLSRGWSAGIVVYAGTNVRLRRSVVLGNVLSGVMVVPTNPPLADGGILNDDISHVDLGTTAPLDGGGTDWGGNVLQGLPDAGQNARAGICLALDPGSGALTATGNTFSGRDCSGSAPGTISASRGACAGGVDVGFQTYVPDAAAYDSGTGYAGNDIDVSSCSK